MFSQNTSLLFYFLNVVGGFHSQQLSCGVELKFCEMRPQNHNT